MIKHKFIYLFAMCAFLYTSYIGGVSAQGLTLGGGINGMKYLGNASKRPTAMGFSLDAGLDLGSKLRISVIPAYYAPVTYHYSEVLGNNTPVESAEQMKLFQATGLVSYALIGSNSGSNLYVGVGPSFAFYNAKIDRTNYNTYNYRQNFNDVLLDARLGGEIGLIFCRLFGEIEIAPPVASNVHNDVYYSPHHGTMVAATAGIRFHIL
jgi:hypothetical protein